MPSSEQIRESIEARLGQLRTEETSLQAARAALHTNGAPHPRSRPTRADGAARKPGRRRPPASASEATATTTQAAPPPAPKPTRATSKPSTKTTTRSPKSRAPAESKPAKRRKPQAVLFAGTLETMLRDAEDGLNAVAIAKQARAHGTQVRDLLRELERMGRVRRTGAGRGSRWRLITDEERIAERAAELEARDTSKP